MSEIQPPATAPAAPPAVPAAPPAPAAAGPAAPAAPAPAGDLTAENQALKAQLAEVRKEAAGYRTGNKGQLAELHKALGSFLGQPIGEQAPDTATVVTQLTKRFEDSEKRIRQLTIDRELGEVFTKHGVKPKLARAVLDSEGLLGSLDPNDAEFGKTLNAAVKKLADDYPELKAVAAPAPAAPRSGLAPEAVSGALPQLTIEEIRGMKPEDVVAAREKGQLSKLMGHTPS